MQYELKYSILPSDSIFNICGPKYQGFRKPNSEEYWVNYINNIKDNFYVKLEASILSEGFKRPILVNSGYCSRLWTMRFPDLFKDIGNMLVCDRWGGSRLWVAQKHNLDIPCLILDFNDKFAHLPTIDAARALSYFRDKPKHLELRDDRVLVFP